MNRQEAEVKQVQMAEELGEGWEFKITEPVPEVCEINASKDGCHVYYAKRGQNRYSFRAWAYDRKFCVWGDTATQVLADTRQSLRNHLQQKIDVIRAQAADHGVEL